GAGVGRAAALRARAERVVARVARGGLRAPRLRHGEPGDRREGAAAAGALGERDHLEVPDAQDGPEEAQGDALQRGQAPRCGEGLRPQHEARPGADGAAQSELVSLLLHVWPRAPDADPLREDVLGKRPQGARVLPPHHANAPRPRRGAHAPFPGGEPNRETRGAAAGRRAGDDHAPRGERHGPGRHAPGAGRASSGQGPAQGAVGALPCGARRRGERGGAAASERPQRARGDAQGEGWRSGWHGSEGGQETGGRPGEAAGGAELGESHRPADPAPVFQHGAQRDKQSQQVQVDDQGGAGPSHDHGQAIGRCLGIGEVRANHGSAGRPLAAPLTPRPGALICRRAEGAIGQRDPRVCLSRFGFSEAAGSGAPGALCAPTGDSAGIPERVEER
ncbi:unnamed protein product, partial [Prorocentrum cordatum]